MKPILKNFSGNGTFEYQIRYQMEENLINLEMHIRTPFVKEWMFYDNVSGIYDSEKENSSVGLKTALTRAEKKWGLKLVKSDLQVA